MTSKTYSFFCSEVQDFLWVVIGFEQLSRVASYSI